MGMKTKSLYKLAGLAGGLISSFGLGDYIGHNRGFEDGKKTVKQELITAGDILTSNCEHYMGVIGSMIRYSKQHGYQSEEIERLREIYKRELDKRNDVQSLVDCVLDDNTVIGVDNQ